MKMAWTDEVPVPFTGFYDTEGTSIEIDGSRYSTTSWHGYGVNSTTSGTIVLPELLRTLDVLAADPQAELVLHLESVSSYFDGGPGSGCSGGKRENRVEQISSTFKGKDEIVAHLRTLVGK